MQNSAFNRCYLGTLKLSREVDLDVKLVGCLRTRLPRAGLGNRILHLANLVSRYPEEAIEPLRHGRIVRSVPSVSDQRIVGRRSRTRLPERRYEGRVLLGDDLLESITRLDRFPLTCLARPIPQVEPYIVLHLRLGDFHVWDKDAIMSKSYFLDAVASVSNKTETQILIVSDEPDSQVVMDLETELRHAEFSARIARGKANEQIYLMTRAEIIIASPSSFSLVAAWMGGQRIAWQLQWAERAASKGSQFWMAACENRIPFLDTLLIDCH